MGYDLSPVEVQFTADMAGLRRDMEEVKRLVGNTVEQAQKAAGQVSLGNDLAAQLKESLSGVNGLSNAFSGLAGVARGAGLAAAGAAIKAVSDSALDGQVQLDKLRNTLTYTSGSADGAGKEMDYVRKVSADLGLELGGTASAYAKLSASAKGTSLEGENVKRIFEAVSKASVVMGLSQEESSGALLAISQMMSKGTVQAEELRGQLGERLPGAFQAAARAMGTTTAGLGKMLEQGQVLSADFLPKFAEELDRSLGQGTEKAAHSAQAAINRMTSAWTEAKMAFAETGAAQPAIDSMTKMSSLMTQFSAGVREAKAAGWNGLSSFLAGIGNMGAAAVGADFTKPVDEQIKLLSTRKVELQRLVKADDGQLGADGLGPARLRSKLQEIADIDKEISRLQRSEGKIEVDLKKDFDAQQAAQRKVLESYVNDASRKTNSQKLADDLKAEEYAFRNATIGLEKGSDGYLKALAATNEKKKDLQKKYKDEDSSPQLSSAYDTLLAKIREKITLDQQEIELGRPLTEAEKMRIQLTHDLDQAMKKKGAGSRAVAEALINEAVAQDQLRKEQADWIKFQEAGEQANIRRLQTLDGELTTLQAEVDNYGLSKSAIEANTIARLEEQRVIVAKAGATEDQLKYLDEEIEKRKALSGLLARKESLDANKKAAEAAAQEWKKVVDDVNRALTDALMKGGKGGMDYLKDYAKSLVVRVAVQWVTSPLTAMVSGVLGGGAGAAIAGGNGGANGGGGFGSNFSFGSLNAGAYDNFAFSNAGQWLGLSEVNGANIQMTDTGAWLGQNGSSVLGYGAALYNLSQGNYGSAAGAAIGTYIMPGIGTAVGSFLGGLFDGGGGEDPHNNADQNGVSIGLSSSGVYGVSYAEFGDRGGYSQLTPNTWTGGQTSGSGRWHDSYSISDAEIAKIDAARATIFDQARAVAEVMKVDQSLIDNVKVANSAFASVEDALTALSNALAKTIIPNIKDFQKSGEKLGETLARVVQETTLYDTWSARASLTLNASGNAAMTAKDKVVTGAGGAQTFDSLMSSYYASFYSADERARQAVKESANTLQQVFADLGKAVPATKSEFRELVSSLDLSTEAGRKNFTQMMKVAGAYDAINASSQTAVAGMQVIVAAMDKVASLKGQLYDALDSVHGLSTGTASLWESLGSATELQKQMDLVGQINAATLSSYQAQREALTGIGNYAKSLLVSDLSPLTAGQKLGTAEQQYQDMLARAKGGDTSAMQGLQSAAGTYLQEARGYYASGQQYSAIFGAVQGTLETMGVSGLADAQSRAATDLSRLVKLTDDWSGELGNSLRQQAQTFGSLNITMSELSTVLSSIDQRIANAISQALAQNAASTVRN